MLKQPITFDSFIRGLIGLAIALCIGLILNRLSGVLLPFFIGWLLAYLMYPLVTFLQYRCRLRNRTLSILVAAVIVLLVTAGCLQIIIPPTIQEFVKLKALIGKFTETNLGDTQFIPWIHEALNNVVAKQSDTLMKLIQEHSVMEVLQSALGYMWTIIYETLGLVMGVLGSAIVLLYMFFILQDYETIAEGWVKLFPQRNRPFASRLASDLKNGMNSYFRGQALVALCVGILFSVGFLIVDFPMAIGLGLFMGFLNLVPYLQTLGLIPMVLLALLRSADTGESFWTLFLLGLLVVAIVQVIQDTFLVPKIMGATMGLKPAVILLSLSVWGSLLGFIGLIIALPLTTILISYYRQFVLEETAPPKDNK
ncbi:MAG: AI-2E family transporter [Bacteroidaceae bacterium]|nr:AI-2E family transporter [Bacteroidaceae bacterium]